MKTNHQFTINPWIQTNISSRIIEQYAVDNMIVRFYLGKFMFKENHTQCIIWKLGTPFSFDSKAAPL